MTITISQTPYLSGVNTGWLITRPGQYEFGGLLMGRGTPYIVQSVSGLFGWDGTAESVKLDTQPGSIPGILSENSKVIEMVVRINSTWGADNIEQCLAEVGKAFQKPAARYNRYVGDYAVHGRIPLAGRTQLAFRRDGYDHPRVVYCRVIRKDLPSDHDLSLGLGTMTIQFQADDPRIYSVFPTKTTISMSAGETAVNDVPLSNLGSYVDGYEPYISISSATSGKGFKNPVLIRKYEDPFHPGHYKTQKVSFTAEFPTVGAPGIANNLGISFKNQATAPLTVAQYMVQDDFWTALPDEDGDQWFGFERAAWAKNAPLTITLLTRDVWV